MGQPPNGMNSYMVAWKMCNITLNDNEYGTNIIPLEDLQINLSEDEGQMLDTVSEKFRGWSATSISNYSHEEKAYIENKHNDKKNFNEYSG